MSYLMNMKTNLLTKLIYEIGGVHEPHIAQKIVTNDMFEQIHTFNRDALVCIEFAQGGHLHHHYHNHYNEHIWEDVYEDQLNQIVVNMGLRGFRKRYEGEEYALDGYGEVGYSH
jgi:hypothetical protein